MLSMVLSLMGGIGLFLYGMSLLSSSLQQIAGGRLEQTLEKVGYHAWTHAGYDFKKAVETAFEQANPGGNVLLSPSCASFDMFKDYEERGRIFKDIVAGMEGARA